MNLFNFLNHVGSKNLFDVLEHEQLQTIAIVLAHLDRDTAASILNMFDEKIKADIAIKMANIDNLSEAVLENIALTLKKRILPRGVKLGGVKAVADILKRLKD